MLNPNVPEFVPQNNKYNKVGQEEEETAKKIVAVTEFEIATSSSSKKKNNKLKSPSSGTDIVSN